MISEENTRSTKHGSIKAANTVPVPSSKTLHPLSSVFVASQRHKALALGCQTTPPVPTCACANVLSTRVLPSGSLNFVDIHVRDFGWVGGWVDGEGRHSLRQVCTQCNKLYSILSVLQGSFNNV